MPTSESVPQESPKFDSTTSGNGEFSGFSHLLHEGSNDAAGLLLRRYSVRLREMASKRIGMKLRPKFDPDDVVQSVLGSFFANLRSGKLDIESSRNLSGILAIMVIRKCARYANRYSTAGRDFSRESGTNIGGDNKLEELCIDKQPLPEETALQNELLEQWTLHCDEMDRRIIELLLLGHTTREVSLQVHCSQRTVQRTVQRFVQRLGPAT